MSTTTPAPRFDESMIRYDVSAEKLSRLSEHCMALTIDGIDDSDGFEAVHKQRMQVRGLRVAIDKRRKEMKADALEYGRAVDARAKELTELIAPAEKHLQDQENAVTEERERIKREAEEAKQRVIDERCEKLAAIGVTKNPAALGMIDDDAFDSLYAIHKQQWDEAQEQARKEAEERERLEAEEREQRRLESERLAAERKQLDEERRQQEEARRADEERLAAERRKLDEERRQLEEQRAREEAAEHARREERARIEREQAKEREREERARIEQQQRVEQERAARELAESQRPDREKLLKYLDDLAAVPFPDISEAMSEDGDFILLTIAQQIKTLRAIVE